MLEKTGPNDKPLVHILHKSSASVLAIEYKQMATSVTFEYIIKYMYTEFDLYKTSEKWFLTK